MKRKIFKTLTLFAVLWAILLVLTVLNGLHRSAVHPSVQSPAHPIVQPSVILFNESTVVHEEIKLPLIGLKDKSKRGFKMHGRLLAQSDPSISNLVIGLAHDCSPDSLAIFIGGIKKTTPFTDVVVFINFPIPERHLDVAAKWNATLVEYRIGRLTPFFINKYHPSSLRWILFDQFFNSQGNFFKNHFKKVLFADVRDTVFQSSPFPFISDVNTFYAFGENSGATIESCGWNSGWVLDCFGQIIYDMVKPNFVICSGISMASFDAGLKYVGIMSSILLGESVFGSKFPACERNGVDQGVHNAVVHLGLLQSMSVKYETDFPITHLQSSVLYDPSSNPLNASLFDTSGISNGLKPLYVVHQYDRFPNIATALADAYVYWKSFKDVVSMWRSEPACSNYQVAPYMDVMAGVCDYGSFRTISPDSCCALCNLKFNGAGKISCTGFAFSNGMCFFKSCNAGERERQVKMYMPDEKDREVRNWSNLKSVHPVIHSKDLSLMSAYLSFK